jgi:hypothetical protein
MLCYQPSPAARSQTRDGSLERSRLSFFTRIDGVRSKSQSPVFEVTGNLVPGQPRGAERDQVSRRHGLGRLAVGEQDVHLDLLAEQAVGAAATSRTPDARAWLRLAQSQQGRPVGCPGDRGYLTRTSDTTAWRWRL